MSDRDSNRAPPIGRVIPMPMRPYTPQLFFMESRGPCEPYYFNAEKWEKAKGDGELRYFNCLKESYERLLARGEVDDEVYEAYTKEFEWLSVRVVTPTYVLKKPG